MNQRYRNILMWALYAALFLAVMLIQTVVFGRMRFFGVKVNLMPAVVTCIGLWVGHESGGIFGLAAGLVWAFTGADDGSLSIVSFTLIGILAGWLCDSLFRRRLLPAVLLSLAALAAHELTLFLLKYYLEEAAFSLIIRVPITAGLSVTAAPILYWLAKAIGKAGGN